MAETWPHKHRSVMVDGDRFPCRLHDSGRQWRCRFRGQVYRFGPTSDPDAALQRWMKEWPQIVRGEAKEVDHRIESWGQLFNAYNQWQWDRADSGRISAVTARKREQHILRFLEALGSGGSAKLVSQMRPSDFLKIHTAWSKHGKDGYRPATIADMTVSIRGACKWARDEGMLAELPRYGQSFSVPEEAQRRRGRREAQRRRGRIPPEDIRALIEHADEALKPCILLGINCGLKWSDMFALKASDVEMKPFPHLSTVRHKTGSDLLAPLWPETLEAIKAAGMGAEDEPLLKCPYARTDKGWTGLLGSDRFRALCDRLQFPKRYQHSTLRHEFYSAGAIVDKSAMKLVVGQISGDVLDETYDHALQDDEPTGRRRKKRVTPLDRCKRVTDAVREWLYELEPEEA